MLLGYRGSVGRAGAPEIPSQAVSRTRVLRARLDLRASCRTSRARRSPARWSPRSARRPRSPSPIALDASSSARSRPDPTSCARTWRASSRRAPQMVDVRAERALVLRLRCGARAPPLRVQAAGVAAGDAEPIRRTVRAADVPEQSPTPAASTPDDDHRRDGAGGLRHARRGVLKDATLPTKLLADSDRRKPRSASRRCSPTPSDRRRGWPPTSSPTRHFPGR